MSPTELWKDPVRRASTGSGAAMPAHPSGLVEFDDDDMAGVGGGSWTPALVTATIALTATKCSPDGTLCGSCQMGTGGCC